MPPIHTPQRERQWWIDTRTRLAGRFLISFRNPLSGQPVSPPRRTWYPILQLARSLPQRTVVQQRHQIQHVPAGPARETVKDLARQIHVKGIFAFPLVERTPPTVPAPPTPFETVDPVMPQDRFHRDGLLDGGKAYLWPPHAATSSPRSAAWL
jgi:hypothetical protein